MKLLLITNALSQLCLAVLLLKGCHYRKHFAFTAFITFGAIELAALFVIPNPSALYFYTYWCCAAFDVVIKTGVVVELFHNVYQVELAEAAKVRRLRLSLLLLGLASIILCLVYPTPSAVPLVRWVATADKATSLALCVCFIAVLFFARGLFWLNRDFGIGAGLIVYFPVRLSVSLVAAFRWGEITTWLSMTEMLAYTIALGIWITFFARPEIKLVSIPLRELQKYAAAVKRQAEALERAQGCE